MVDERYFKQTENMDKHISYINIKSIFKLVYVVKDFFFFTNYVIQYRIVMLRSLEVLITRIYSISRK